MSVESECDHMMGALPDCVVYLHDIRPRRRYWLNRMSWTNDRFEYCPRCGVKLAPIWKQLEGE